MAPKPNKAGAGIRVAPPALERETRPNPGIRKYGMGPRGQIIAGHVLNRARGPTHDIMEIKGFQSPAIDIIGDPSITRREEVPPTGQKRPPEMAPAVDGHRGVEKGESRVPDLALAEQASITLAEAREAHVRIGEPAPLRGIPEKPDDPIGDIGPEDISSAAPAPIQVIGTWTRAGL